MQASVGTGNDTMGESKGGLALAVRGVVKRYGATVALNGVTFDIAAGSAHALIGENGAGKSTLVKIVSGITRPDSGEIELFGGGDHRRRSGHRVAVLAARERGLS
jgi:ribose transport system ATP-binding protein